ncbi:TD and POZ domain-containing protein 5 [Argiope bruennichi]|uniref:TD and POZ domain-containing protein 5 n=1 Tax=Argiope bruennichi TaxID=94029 RepID=A0A8T0EHB5_ARGBR|nr:TD and POZ domain-containing protein 5 [Argiope bruennichi]
MALILYLKRNSVSEDLCVDFLVGKGIDYGYGIQISVLDVNGVVIASTAAGCMAELRKDILNIRNIISKNKLIINKELFIPNDTLLFKCSLVVSDGVISNDIEYYTPNVSLVLKEKEEALNSQVEEIKAIFNDANLRFGAKLYPVHKNILCSRSLVFSMIFGKDKEENTIEINGMKENTLKRLLQYVYTDTVGDLQFENALDLYKAAAMYELLDLKDKCSDVLIGNFSDENSRDFQSLANEYPDEKLETAARFF